MKLSELFHHPARSSRPKAPPLDPVAAARAAARIKAFNTGQRIRDVLLTVKNLPLKLDNAGFKAELTLKRFADRLDTELPSKQDYAAMKSDVLAIEHGLKAMEESLRPHQGKPGSRNHSEYLDFLNKKQGMPLKALLGK
jgi:hypothetical protein